MILKAVLFDMDGVIVDTEPLHKKAYFEMFSEYKLDISQELFSTFTGRTTQSVCDEIISTFKPPHLTSQDLIKKKREIFEESFYNDAEFDLLPGVRDLIIDYHTNGIKLVLASSASRKTIDMVFKKFNLDQYFIGKISGADLKESKPNPEIFIKAAEIAKTPRENCIVIEDSTNGIKAAYLANIYCVAYKSPHTELQDYTLSSKIITDYNEILTEKFKEINLK